MPNGKKERSPPSERAPQSTAPFTPAAAVAAGAAVVGAAAIGAHRPRGRRLSRSGHKLLQRLGIDASQLDLARGRRLDCLARALVALPGRVVRVELELELIQSHMAQKPVLRGEVRCACVEREDVDGELREDGDAVGLVVPLQAIASKSRRACLRTKPSKSLNSSSLCTGSSGAGVPMQRHRYF